MHINSNKVSSIHRRMEADTVRAACHQAAVQALRWQAPIDQVVGQLRRQYRACARYELGKGDLPALPTNRPATGRSQPAVL